MAKPKEITHDIKTMYNHIYEEDCREAMRRIPSKSIDMILCDLPYGTTENPWDSVIPLEELWEQYWRILKERGVIVLTSQGLFTAQLMMSQHKHFKYKWVWVKSKATNFLNAKRQPLRKHEEVCVFYKKAPMYNPQMTPGEAYNKGVRKDQLTGSYGDFKPVLVQSEGERYPTDILYIKTAECEGEVYHPTQKPVELGSYFVKTYTKEGDVVLDNTSGSGSFLVAALKEGRNFIGIEMNAESEKFKDEKVDFVEISKKRLKEAWLELDWNKREKLEKVNLIEDFERESRGRGMCQGK